MTEHTLNPHLIAPPPAAFTVRARAELTPAGTALEVVYRLCGDLTQARIPAPAAARRVDRLWERTCFEAFVRPEEGDRYFELNFSPSSEWAAYALERYRHGQRPLLLPSPPRISVQQEANELCVTARVDLGVMADARLPWHVGLTAVVADADGRLTYWALRHPRPKPDFHDAAGFLVRLEGPGR